MSKYVPPHLRGRQSAEVAGPSESIPAEVITYDSTIFKNAKVKSELPSRDDQRLPRNPRYFTTEEGKWCPAMLSESVEHFLARQPPSKADGVAWVSAHHEEREYVVESYYQSARDSAGELLAGGIEWIEDRDGKKKRKKKLKDKIRTEWQNPNFVRSQESLKQLLKKHRYGCGKWMLFVSGDGVDALWAKVLRALWDGALGHSAKCSGLDTGAVKNAGPNHVICVYVDPFWEKDELTRVLSGIRDACGVTGPIKFKADGVTLLDIYKDNHHGIQPSFFESRSGTHVREAVSIAGSTAYHDDKGNSKWRTSSFDRTWGTK